MLHLEAPFRDYGEALLTLIQTDAGDRGRIMLKMRILLSTYPDIVDFEIPSLRSGVVKDFSFHLDEMLLDTRDANDVEVATQGL